MKKFIVMFVFVLGLSSSVFGHTGYQDTVICPVCDNSVIFHLTMSRTSFGGFKDFQEQGAIGNYYEEMINACKNCYYSGYHSDYDTTFTETEIVSIKKAVSKYKDQELDDALECEIAADIKMISEFKFDQIANIYLISTYFLRTDSSEIERRKVLQLRTAQYLDKALANNEYDKHLVATINYLIGEMYRRTGNHDKAILNYDLAIKDKKRQKWVKAVAIEQKKLAINKDDNNEI